MVPGCFIDAPSHTNRQTQAQNVQFASSSALGSKQFTTQAAKLEHAVAVEESRRNRARKILDRADAGKQHLSDESSGEDEAMGANGSTSDDDDDDDDAPLEREFIKPQQALAKSTTAPFVKRSAQPFNPSGSLGVVAAAEAAPVASTSSATSTSSAKANVAPAVGSALAAGATVTVVKRKPKQRGSMRQLVTAVGKGKGKAKAVAAEEEDEESDFNSSEATSSDEDLDGGTDAGEEEWQGIVEAESATKDAGESDEAGEKEGGPSDDDGSSEGDEDDSDDEQDADDASADRSACRPPRERGTFRAWADAQVLAASGVDAEPVRIEQDADDGSYKPLLPAGSGFKNKPDPEGVTGPLGAPLPQSELPTLPPQRTVHIAVQRTPEIEASRAELPVVKEEDRVMATILGHSVTVLCGETGSGKTTQVGQFLWEAGFGDPSSGESRLFARPSSYDSQLMTSFSRQPRHGRDHSASASGCFIDLGASASGARPS